MKMETAAVKTMLVRSTAASTSMRVKPRLVTSDRSQGRQRMFIRSKVRLVGVPVAEVGVFALTARATVTAKRVNIDLCVVAGV